MPRCVVVSVGISVGAAPNPDLWDFCGARRRPPAARAVGRSGTTGSGFRATDPRLGPTGLSASRAEVTGCIPGGRDALGLEDEGAGAGG